MSLHTIRDSPLTANSLLARELLASEANDTPTGWRLGYVLYSPDTDEYLASVVDAGPMNILAWCKTPDVALRWESMIEAEQAAHERVEHQAESGNRSYSIEVSEVLDNGDRILARTAAQIVPSQGRILSSAELAGLGFSYDFRPIADSLGIRPTHARTVVERPDRITHHAASAATLYIRRVASMRPERHLLVIVDRMSERPQIIAAWPVPVSLAGSAPSPLAALYALCAATGNTMVLRGDQMPLVLGERHPEFPEDLSEVISVEDSSGVLQVRIGEDPVTGEMLIGWAYSIDDDRLAAILKA